MWLVIGATTSSTKTLSVVTFTIKTLTITVKKTAACRYALCHYSDCLGTCKLPFWKMWYVDKSTIRLKRPLKESNQQKKPQVWVRKDNSTLNWTRGWTWRWTPIQKSSVCQDLDTEIAFGTRRSSRIGISVEKNPNRRCYNVIKLFFFLATGRRGN